MALLCRHLADTCLHVFTAADEPAILGSAPASGAADAQAIRRARADRRLVRKVVYDRDTILRSLYGPTEAGLALRRVPLQETRQTKVRAEVGAVRSRSFGEGVECSKC